MPRTTMLLLAPALVASVLTLGACSAPPRNAVPADLVLEAHVPGLPGVRNVEHAASGPETERGWRDWLAEHPAAWNGARPVRFLAISGGGPNGAFGAGLLVGWTARGDRPDFQLVTGISTGALTAPFAFLGPDYDHVLREVYTGISTADVLDDGGIVDALFHAIFGEAFASTAPLEQLLERHVNDDVIEHIAQEHRKGRRLLVGTTNLDLMRIVYWSIGDIAASEHPERGEIIRRVLLASASIPGAFPPVVFDVTAAGATYDELHVDGGVSTQLFAYPLDFDLGATLKEAGVSPDRAIYVIRNAQLDPPQKVVNRRALDITRRSISSLISTQSHGDMYRVFLGAARDGFAFRLADIPEDVDRTPSELFDTAYMTELYELGRQMAARGFEWQETPPGFTPHTGPARR